MDQLELNDKIHGSQGHRHRFYGGFIIVSDGSMLMNFVETSYTRIYIPGNLVFAFIYTGSNFHINHVHIQVNFFTSN